MENLNTLLITFSEFLCIYFIVRKQIHQNLLPKAEDMFSFLCILLIIGEASADFPFLSCLLGQLIYLTYIWLVYKRKNPVSGALLFSVTYILAAMLQFVAAALMSILPFTIPEAALPYAGNLLTLLLAVLLHLIPPVCNLYERISHAAKPYRFIMINTYIVLFIIMLVLKLNPTDLFSNTSVILSAVLFLVAANACILYYDQKLNARNQELVSYQKNLPIYKSLIDDIRASQHEYSNRLQSLRFLTETCKTYEELREALNKYTEDYSHPLHAYPLLLIDKPLLAASLYNLALRAEEVPVTIQFDVVAHRLQSQAPESVVADLTCILLQNAIEACKPGDSIYVHLSSDNGRTRFEVRNPSAVHYSAREINNFFRKDYSTKKDRSKEDGLTHGLGLHHLLKEVQKYDGTIGADCILFHEVEWVVFCLTI